MKRPYVICHMMASIDGRIDCDMTEQIGGNEYYEALEMLCIDTTIEGKTTAVNHYAEKERFVPQDAAPVGKEEFYRSHDAKRWEAVVDTRGTLRWSEDDTPDRICIVSQQASREYLDYLRQRGISYIVTGEKAIDLSRALSILQCEFGSERIGVVGGGHINGSFLREGLLDEVSMLYGAAIDGREGFCAAFEVKVDELTSKQVDELSDNCNNSSTRQLVNSSTKYHPYMLRLKSVRQIGDNSVWIRYSCI